MSEDKNVFISSYNQMGGITAQSVNLGPTARSMNEDLGNQLKQHIPVSASVRITSVLGDGEAFGFANQVLTWMRDNGYGKVEGVDQAVYTQPVTGQTLDKKSDDEFEIIIGSRP